MHSWRGYLFIGTLAIFLAPTASAQAATRLPISFHRQEHSLSCEVATLKMALATHSIATTEDELIAKLPFDPTPKGNGVWGDPNQGFVGSIDGSMLGTGYGVYWDPIADLGARYTATEVIRHGSASEVARHVAAGNPVIVWGYYGRRAVHNWQTPSGATAKAVDGEHTRVVYGFDGTTDKPTQFYLVDPIDGHLVWSTEQFMYNWSALNHMGVVVKPPRQWARTTADNRVWEIDYRNNVRHWITTWDTFVSRGGTKDGIVSIDKEELVKYSIGAALE